MARPPASGGARHGRPPRSRACARPVRCAPAPPEL